VYLVTRQVHVCTAICNNTNNGIAAGSTYREDLQASQ